jgi:hypothetical protein
LADLVEIRYGILAHEAAEQQSFVKLGAVKAIHQFWAQMKFCPKNLYFSSDVAKEMPIKI